MLRVVMTKLPPAIVAVIGKSGDQEVGRFKVELERKRRASKSTRVVRLGTIERNPMEAQGSPVAWAWWPSDSLLRHYPNNPWDCRESITGTGVQAVRRELEAKLWCALIGDTGWTNLGVGREELVNP